MELALLFVLLPIAALSGWWIGRRTPDKSAPQKETAFSSNYFKGLNFLLNEQPDKAIDVFVKMLEVDSETVETHLALGNLFRRRGESDRAIRIHQNLIARPTLNKDQRVLALFELGQDYLRAGLLGRAETLFLELLDQGSFRSDAMEKLLDIYQQERDWQKAIEITKRLENFSGRNMAPLMAQFYCEQGDNFKAKGDFKVALKMAKKALATDRQSVRASLLQADIEKLTGHCKAAVKTLKQVEKQDGRYLPEVVEPLLECYQSLGKPHEAERYLSYLLDEHGGITPLLALVDLMRQREGERAASDRIVSFLRERPSVRGLDRLIELHLVGSDGVARENLMILKELTRRLLEGKAAYRCKNCGFKAKVLQWSCPGCKQWGSIHPIHGVIGE
ncbi:MAG: lipopolysaccharide assembly protein LapB [Gammaproteobacteria bacterium]